MIYMFYTTIVASSWTLLCTYDLEYNPRFLYSNSAFAVMKKSEECRNTSNIDSLTEIYSTGK